ncbi:MAG: hypothetical protein JWQ16_888, partial [Novosphingobium sp.]|nr:hypothetical protein [Novosphingobium sp.]
VLMLMFAATGVTLNHADIFEDRGEAAVREFLLPEALRERLSRLAQGSVLPTPVIEDIRGLTGADLSARKVDNQYGELVFDLAAPGRDRVLTIDLNAKAVTYEVTDRGTVAWLNDLHKGRHAGGAWKLLIDVAAAFFLIFALTGFGLLALNAQTRASTWPLTALGLLAPVVVLLLLIH